MTAYSRYWHQSSISGDLQLHLQSDGAQCCGDKGLGDTQINCQMRLHVVTAAVTKMLFSEISIDCVVLQILSDVLHGCKTWSATLKKEHKLQMQVIINVLYTSKINSKSDLQTTWIIKNLLYMSLHFLNIRPLWLRFHLYTTWSVRKKIHITSMSVTMAMNESLNYIKIIAQKCLDFTSRALISLYVGTVCPSC